MAVPAYIKKFCRDYDGQGTSLVLDLPDGKTTIALLPFSMEEKDVDWAMGLLEQICLSRFTDEETNG